MARKRIADQTKGIGKPKVGGPFELVDQDGNVFSSDDMLGKYSLVCDTACPICIVGYRLTCATGLLWLHPLPRYLPR
jgi:cytochrome oxidase Cu insertion factor (SCO1/SenC/PrrC family)